MFIDNRKKSIDEPTTSVRIYEQDKQRLQDELQNPNMTMADRVRVAVRALEDDDRQHPYVPYLHRLQDELRREGYTEEADHLELLAGLWGRMEADVSLRKDLAEKGLDGIRDALSFNALAEREEDPLTEVEP